MGSGGHFPVLSKQFSEKKKQMDLIWLEGHYEKGLTEFRIAAESSRKSGHVRDELWFLHGLGACQFAMFQFQSALKTMTAAREIARAIQDEPILAKISLNLSALYEQIDNLPESEVAAGEGLKYADYLEPVTQALLYIQVGRIRAMRGEFAAAEEAFHQAIALAREANGENAEAWALDALAYAKLEAGKLDEAESAAKQSLTLRKNPKVGGVDNSYMILGMVRARQGDLAAGIALLDQAEAGLHQRLSLTPPWMIYMRRGEIKNQSQDWRGALVDLRHALASAREWRVDIPPNDADRTSSEKKLDELYQALVEAGNRLYLTTHDDSLIRETFETAEENRAASLRALVPQDSDWRKRLPSHYYELLAKLQAGQSAQLRNPGDSGASTALDALRLELAQIEASAGGSASHRRTKALDQAQAALTGNAVLFSFQLGEKGSWMWAVTNDGISLHTAPPRRELEAKVADLQRAAVSNALEPDSGMAIYRDLFGSVPSQLAAREHWLLILDGALFNLPFPALRAERDRFLIEDHSLSAVPGALMLRNARPRGPSGDGFLAVGDPIYNLADPRARKDIRRSLPALILHTTNQQAPAFARLWGTAKEIEVSARAWNAPGTVLLTGEQAVPEDFWNNAEKKPAIIHIATHILEENEWRKTGWIAFGLGRDARVQYITPEDILAKSVSARLVVLSGCSSGKADIQPATGLKGLTRAWIAAGAGAVLATRWPIVDDDGAFFASFYRHLRDSESNNPADALRKASIEMLKSGNWRSNPSFWAGYFLIGNH
jgi:CHAT domain-containing protein